MMSRTFQKIRIPMRYFPTVVALVAASALTASAQNNKAEKDVRGFLALYEKAVPSRDIAFLERVMGDDYVYSGPSGKMTTRAQALKYFKQQRDNPDFKSNSLKHENVKVHVSGNMALVTNDWTAQTTPSDATDVEPTTDRGRYTGVLEKRNGRWMIIAEHDSERIHDDKWMVAGVLKARRDYDALIRRLRSGRSYSELEQSGDIAALGRTLADEYTRTTRDGQIFNKAQDLESYKTDHSTITNAELSEQNVRTIDNNAAIETAKARYAGTNAGVPFDVTTRYTTTWAFYDGRWQITAGHASLVKP